MILSDKANGFFEYAKKKKWDCSLIIYDKNYMAILNPISKAKVYEGESPVDGGSMDEAIANCKLQMQKDKKNGK